MKSELIEAAKEIQLDLLGVQKETELRRFLEIAASQQATGIVALWYWQEDESRMARHDSSQTYGKNWVAYADSVVSYE